MTQKVLQLSRWVGVQRGGGIQTYIETLAKSVDQYGVQFSYAGLMPGSKPSYASGRVWVGREQVPKWRNACSLWFWMGSALDDVDLVHIHGVTDWHFFVAAAACRRMGVPYVVSVHGGLMPAALEQIKYPRFMLNMGMKTILRYLLRGAERVITTSDLEDASIRALDSRIKSRLLFPGVVNLNCSDDQAHGERPRKILRILYLGRIEPMKSLPTMLGALDVLERNGMRVQLDIVGDDSGAYAAKMKMLAEELSVADRIQWHGYRAGAEKWRYLQSADVLVMPSLTESFGFSAAEAMSVGTPVIVSDAVGLANWVRQYDAGSVFQMGSAEALAQCIQSYQSKAVWQRKADNARRCAHAEFSLEAMGKVVCALYSDAISSSAIVSPRG